MPPLWALAASEGRQQKAKRGMLGGPELLGATLGQRRSQEKATNAGFCGKHSQPRAHQAPTEKNTMKNMKTCKCKQNNEQLKWFL